MNTEFTSSSGMNSATQKVANCALSYLDYFYPNFMVWIKDINENNKMGYYTSGSVVQKSNGWGTPLQDNIGE